MYGARARVCMRACVLQVRAPAPARVFCPTCSCLCPDCPVGTDIGLVRQPVVAADQVSIATSIDLSIASSTSADLSLVS